MPYVVPGSRKRAYSDAISTRATKSAKAVARKKPNYVPRGIVNFGRQAFPKMLRNTIKYSDITAITLTTGFGQYLFSCNGLYDPNITGTGHQPMYFDQLMQIYDHYTVTASRIKLQPINTTQNILCGVFVDDDTTTGLAVGVSTTLIEKPGCVWKAMNGSFQEWPTLRNSWKASQYFGPGTMADPNMQGSVGANPSEQSYYVIGCFDATASAAGSVTVVVEIEYDVIWDELTSMPPS